MNGVAGERPLSGYRDRDSDVGPPGRAAASVLACACAVNNG
jgi:hypothetical protein